MAIPLIKSSFTAGEVAPALFGHVDFALYSAAASTMRNMFVSYKGGSYSRAGTRFCNFSMQTGRNVPPRMIPFQFSITQGLALEFGNFYFRVFLNGSPVTEAPIAITGASQANPCAVTVANSWNAGDWLFIAGIDGMTELNGNFYVVDSASGTEVTLQDVYGNTIDATGFSAYVSGGTAARVYTKTTPWAEADLEWLKFTQSADAMSICCVNQVTGTEYPPYDLVRNSDTSWSLTEVAPAPTIAPPSSTSATASDSGAVDYEYVVTAVNPADGSESIASEIALASNAVDIASTAGSITVWWAQVAGADSYNVYKATPGYGAAIPVGVQFGFAGSAYGNSFVDSNIVADYTQVPPTGQNPFARGSILGAVVTDGGSGYDTACTIGINTATGSGAILAAVVNLGVLVGIIVVEPGSGYALTDTITVTGDGTLATATLTVGPESGTYPGVVSYFQERRAYAYTLNDPDTYFFSQPGAFTNFNSRIPPIDSDAIIGTPWSVQVNGVQWMIQTSGGLLVLTGTAAWLLVGAGTFATNVQPISPSSQDAVPQAFSGVSPTVAPTRINYDVLFVESKGSFYYDLPYQLYALSEPLDITELSTHLFAGYTIRENAWCEQPYKLLWATRSDGVLLSLTWYKTQQVKGWARHDTLGQFWSVCSVTELPVDALYLGAQRYIGANVAYTVERMDSRIWASAEDSWCVDCGIATDLPTPNATLFAQSPTGLGAISGVAAGAVGGSGYSPATTATVVDDNGEGPGSGAAIALTIAGGVITAWTVTAEGASYVSPAIVIYDPSGQGSGASASAVLNNQTRFIAGAGVFSRTDVGSVIRMGGGIATITQYVAPARVEANITSPIVAVLPNSSEVAVQPAGSWSLAVPSDTVSGLEYLAGAIVTGLADGVVVPPTLVPASGVVALAAPATDVVLGLGFQAQLQSVYLDAGAPTVQGQRKKVAAVTVRVEASRDFEVGSNQVDGSTLSPAQIAPVWQNMQPADDKGVAPYGSNVIPLYTGDTRVPVGGGIGTPGQVCVQQNNPLPLNVLAFIPEVLEGDTPSEAAPKKQARGGR